MFERIWADDESIKGLAEAEKDARQSNLDCNDIGESLGSISRRWYIAKFERLTGSSIDDKDSS